METTKKKDGRGAPGVPKVFGDRKPKPSKNDEGYKILYSPCQLALEALKQAPVKAKLIDEAIIFYKEHFQK